MKRIVFKVLSADRTVVASLITMILVVALGGIRMSQVVADSMLRADAESTCSTWADSLQNSLERIPAGGSANDALQHAVQIGDVYRFRIWNSKGKYVSGSSRTDSAQDETLGSLGSAQRVVEVIASGEPFTEVHHGRTPDSPKFFAQSFIPVKENGKVADVVEVYLDQTGDRALYQQSLIRTEGIIALAALLAGGIPVYLAYRKMVEHRAAQSQALYLAEHDSLTGVPNRKRLAETARAALAWSRRNKSFVAALMIDMDRFKNINDSLGHGAGDEVLKAFAQRLQSAIREEDMVARLGGDEFVILQVGIAQPNGASHLARRLAKILSEPYEIGEAQLVCSASIGVAISPTDASEWETLLSCADTALYKAKSEGRNTACFFQAGMDEAVRKRLQMESDLRRALNSNAFQIAYQPQIRVSDQKLTGFEALLRWPENWKPVGPAEFIPIAEECGLIVPIGAWVLEHACKTAAAWETPLSVAVNLSPVQFRQGDIVATVQEALKKSGLDPTRLELEVTESLWLQNSDSVLMQLARLREMGISIALDDFGTGFSSLTYLLRFPFDRVKIDRSFVSEMEEDPKAAAIVDTVLALGRTLHLTITAEGVETVAQANALLAAGCDQAQGYYFGRPLPEASADQLAHLDTGGGELGSLGPVFSGNRGGLHGKSACGD